METHLTLHKWCCGFTSGGLLSPDSTGPGILSTGMRDRHFGGVSSEDAPCHDWQQTYHNLFGFEGMFTVVR